MDQAPAQPNTVQVVAKQDRFAQKVVMLCVWWNFEAIINHIELVQTGAVNAALYSEHLDDKAFTPLSLIVIQQS